jgi:DNA replication protein DnaC
LRRLDTYEVLILDDIGYVQQSRDEMEVLFTLLAERYERRSVVITSNLVFSQWEQIFKDPMTTFAVYDSYEKLNLSFNAANIKVDAQEFLTIIENMPELTYQLN